MLFSTFLLLSVLTGVGQPDKFWLDDGPAKAGGEPLPLRVVEGVLLDEDATSYHLRVEGGEVWLPKNQVVKVEKDGLTTAQIEQKERAAAEQRARAQAARAAEAAAAMRGHATEAAATPAPTEPPAAPAPLTPAIEPAPPTVVPTAHYDPVLHVHRSGAPTPEAELMRDLEVAYKLTRDRDYLKVLRRLRRLR